jgi:hypothetical protein
MRFSADEKTRHPLKLNCAMNELRVLYVIRTYTLTPMNELNPNPIIPVIAIFEKKNLCKKSI